MSERDDYEPGVPCWVAVLQPDVEAAGAFYAGLFGWDLVAPGDGPREGQYLVGRLRGRDVAGITPLPPMINPPPPAGWDTHVRVDRVEDTAERVSAAGGRVVFGPFDAPPAGRLGVMADPAGAIFCAWEAETRKGAQLVNEPGAWAMSRLDTPDPEGAAAFYGAVFGWTTETFEVGRGAVTLFRLPGYVGGEPEQPVSREVVAIMAAVPPGTPPRWQVDFWIEDVDAAVATACRLGGAVLGGPADAPVGRSAVLADPAGAVFSVSQVGGAG